MVEINAIAADSEMKTSSTRPASAAAASARVAMPAKGGGATRCRRSRRSSSLAARAPDQLLGEPRRLARKRRPHLRALDDFADRAPHLLASQRIIHRPVERTALDELSRRALDHLVPRG